MNRRKKLKADSTVLGVSAQGPQHYFRLGIFFEKLTGHFTTSDVPISISNQVKIEETAISWHIGFLHVKIQANQFLLLKETTFDNKSIVL